MGPTNSGKASWPAGGPLFRASLATWFWYAQLLSTTKPRRALRITVREFLSLTACKKRWNSGLQEEHETLRFFQNKHHYCFGRLCCLKRIEKQHRSAGFSGVFSPPCRHHQHFKTILWKHGRHCSVLLSIWQNHKAIQDYASELTSEKNKNLMAKLKKQNFLIWSLPCAIPTESKLLLNIFGMSE